MDPRTWIRKKYLQIHNTVVSTTLISAVIIPMQLSLLPIWTEIEQGFGIVLYVHIYSFNHSSFKIIQECILKENHKTVSSARRLNIQIIISSAITDNVCITKWLSEELTRARYLILVSSVQNQTNNSRRRTK